MEGCHAAHVGGAVDAPRDYGAVAGRERDGLTGHSGPVLVGEAGPRAVLPTPVPSDEASRYSSGTDSPKEVTHRNVATFNRPCY